MHKTVSKLRCLPLLETIVICVWNCEPRLYTFERLPFPHCTDENTCSTKRMSVKGRSDVTFLRATYMTLIINKILKFLPCICRHFFIYYNLSQKLIFCLIKINRIYCVLKNLYSYMEKIKWYHYFEIFHYSVYAETHFYKFLFINDIWSYNWISDLIRKSYFLTLKYFL